ncbi:MAG: aldose 1-epimerase family protein [candidate division KSB1 bacterium]|nr:aldose 1-epimerase family protein [candidate division KSB1 bacterium]MDZ7336135.1 aldose 1-epimerase family protein [candidate division KSB1 bacterium]MDZ7357705.1 aldose 1-epimerase family protein [candidate division KSB1 bacterium]MDZ7401278.1 aldose 1-epimerase family protein [candidate division KSB1 bacterium]
MKLYGRNWTRRDLEARVGRLEQIGGVRRFELKEGPEAGAEFIQVRTGSGLSYYVSPMRCLDISLTEFGGVPISWQASTGEMHPAYYRAEGMEWLRTAAGGLLMTCGLRQVGSPNEDHGESLGLHGRIHHLPARQVSAQGFWVNDEYEMIISGVIEETRIFGEYLRLTRQIRSRLGENSIAIHDQIENLGFEPSPLMVLYHFNFGFPLMSEETKIVFPSRKVVPREPETPLEGYQQWQSPTPGYRERVYYHEDFITSSDREAWATAVIENPGFPIVNGGTCCLSVRLSWSTENLPRLVQWKMPGAGVHVLGIEPANCHVGGRAMERQEGTLRFIEPGQVLHYELKMEIEVK